MEDERTYKVTIECSDGAVTTRLAGSLGGAIVEAVMDHPCNAHAVSAEVAYLVFDDFSGDREVSEEKGQLFRDLGCEIADNYEVAYSKIMAAVDQYRSRQIDIDEKANGAQ